MYSADAASSGNSQRVAFVYDTRFVRPNAVTEIEVDRIEIQGKDIFDRDPLVGHFTFLVEGTDHNDLLVVGLHLASGQHNNRNHDAAMTRLLRELDQLRAEGTVLQAGEFDILLAGDLNANMFDNKVEEFFTSMDSGDWDVLAEAPYPATRLSGVPLQPRNSRIDYIIASRVNGVQRGLSGEEITASAATVHQDLADDDWDTFREQFSDHFPVTTCVGVVADAD